MRWYKKAQNDPFAFPSTDLPPAGAPGQEGPRRGPSQELEEPEAQKHQLVSKILNMLGQKGPEELRRIMNFVQHGPKMTPQESDPKPTGETPMQVQRQAPETSTSEEPQPYERESTSPEVHRLRQTLPGQVPPASAPQAPIPPKPIEEGRSPEMQEWLRQRQRR